MVLKVVVDVTDCCVCPFPSRSGLVYEEIDLSWEALAHNSKYPTLPRSLEEDWPRLHGIAGDVDLLGVIKGIVHHDI